MQDAPGFPTVNIWSMNGRSTERLFTAWVDGDFWAANGFENAAGVGRGVLQGCIAMNCRDAQEAQMWMMSGNKDCKCIL